MKLFWLTLAGLWLCFLPVVAADEFSGFDAPEQFSIEGSFANQIAFHPADSRIVAVAQDNGLISLWDVVTKQPIYVWKGADAGIVALAFMPDGSALVTADDTGNIIIWNTDTFQPDFIMFIDEALPVLLDVAQNKLIAVGYEDGKVRLWDGDNGSHLATIYGYNSEIVALDMSQDGSKLAFGYGWGSVFVYQLEDLEKQQIYLKTMVSAGELNALLFHPTPEIPAFYDNFGLMTISNFHSLQVWNLLTSPSSYYAESDMAYPVSMSLTHDGSLLAVGGKINTNGGDCNIDLCKIELFRQDEEGRYTLTATMQANRGWMTSVVFSPDDRFLASASMDGSIFIWQYLQN